MLMLEIYKKKIEEVNINLGENPKEKEIIQLFHHKHNNKGRPKTKRNEVETTSEERAAESQSGKPSSKASKKSHF